MSRDDEFVMDPDVKREIDNALSDGELIGRAMGGAGSEERIPVVEGWLPGEDEWQGKTIITKREAVAHALTKNLAMAFPEIKPMESFLISAVDDLEMLFTSIDGKAREQHMEVLRAMFGAGKTDNEEAMATASLALAGAMERDDD